MLCLYDCGGLLMTVGVFYAVCDLSRGSDLGV